MELTRLSRNSLGRLFALGLHERIKPPGLAPAQFMALAELWSDDGLTQRELASRLNVKQATMAAAQAQNVRAMQQLSDQEREVFVDLMIRTIAAMQDRDSPRTGFTAPGSAGRAHRAGHRRHN